MAFLYYNRKNRVITNSGETFSLAGYNLIFNLWELRGKPTDQGWHVCADDLIKEYSGGDESHESGALIIDFDPKSKWRIGLIELLDIYIYTYSGSAKDAACWSPMMLRFRDVLYEEFEKEIKEHKKKDVLKEIITRDDNDDFVEFLYLNGSDKGWNWGANGRTNAAFIQGAARDYFKNFF